MTDAQENLELRIMLLNVLKLLGGVRLDIEELPATELLYHGQELLDQLKDKYPVFYKPDPTERGLSSFNHAVEVVLDHVLTLHTHETEKEKSDARQSFNEAIHSLVKETHDFKSRLSKIAVVTLKDGRSKLNVFTPDCEDNFVINQVLAMHHSLLAEDQIVSVEIGTFTGTVECVGSAWIKYGKADQLYSRVKASWKTGDEIPVALHTGHLPKPNK